MKSFQAYCVRRIIFSVTLVVFFCIVAGCGQAAATLPGKASATHSTSTTPKATPTQPSAPLGHLQPGDGWDVTLLSAEFNDTYPIVENTNGERTAPNHSPDWLLVLHMRITDISDTRGIASMGQYMIFIEPLDASPFSSSLQYTPADESKSFPLRPFTPGQTRDIDLVFSITKGGMTEHGTVTFDLTYSPYTFEYGTVPKNGWPLATFTAS